MNFTVSYFLLGKIQKLIDGKWKDPPDSERLSITKLEGQVMKNDYKARSHDPFVRIRFLLVPKNGSCEHINNDLPSNGSVILKKRMEIEHALFSSDTLLER